MPSRKLIIAMAGMVVASCLPGGMIAADRPATRTLGLMNASGTVLVDHLPVLPSSVVFPGDTVTTSKGSAAVVKFHSGLTLALTENSELELPRQADSNDMRIRQGILKINNPEPQAARIHLLGTTVVVRGRGGVPATCTISAHGSHAEVIAELGETEIFGRGAPVRLTPGKFARLEAGAGAGNPQAARKAGTVNNAIPAETIQRQGQGAPLPLKIRDDVDWQDVVQTENTGRVRIMLLDGSVLNIGARSVMRIVEHNPQSQQTQVELTLGKMRSQVMKLTKSGSKFEVKTQTAVIGVVGTIFVVEADQASTKVTCIEGEVLVQNINPAIQGKVHLNPGQSTTVAADAAPTAAGAANAAELQTAVERTEIPPGAGSATTGGQVPATGGGQAAGGQAPGAAGGGQTGMDLSRAAVPGVSGGGTSITVGTAALAAASGAAAVTGVTALSKANDASNAASAAITAAQNATAAANTATTVITQSQQSTPSSSTPCGCGP